jgi:hypothetical protein
MAGVLHRSLCGTTAQGAENQHGNCCEGGDKQQTG